MKQTTNLHPSSKTQEHLSADERSSHLSAGIITLIVACLMAAIPTVLALRHILDLSSANVLFGMAVWYIFAICAAAAGIYFLRRGQGAVNDASDKQTGSDLYGA